MSLNLQLYGALSPTFPPTDREFRATLLIKPATTYFRLYLSAKKQYTTKALSCPLKQTTLFEIPQAVSISIESQEELDSNIRLELWKQPSQRVLSKKDKRLGWVSLPLQSLLLRHARLSDGITFEGESSPIISKDKHYANVVLFTEVVGWQHFGAMLGFGSPAATASGLPLPARHSTQQLIARSQSLPSKLDTSEPTRPPPAAPVLLSFSLDKRKELDRHLDAVRDLIALCQRLFKKRAQSDISISEMKVRQYIKQDIVVKLIALTTHYQRGKQHKEVFDQIKNLWILLAQDLHIKANLVDLGIFSTFRQLLCAVTSSKLLKLAIIQILKHFFGTNRLQQRLVSDGVLQALVSFTDLSAPSALIIAAFELLRYFDMSAVTQMLAFGLLNKIRAILSITAPSPKFVPLQEQAITTLKFFGTGNRQHILSNRKLLKAILRLEKSTMPQIKLTAIDFVNKFNLHTSSLGYSVPTPVALATKLLDEFIPIIVAPETDPLLRLNALEQIRTEVLKTDVVEHLRDHPKLVSNLLKLTCSPNSVLRDQSKSFLSALHVSEDKLLASGMLLAYRDLLTNPKLSPGLHIEVLTDIGGVLSRHQTRLIEEKYHLVLAAVVCGAHSIPVRLKALEILLKFQWIVLKGLTSKLIESLAEAANAKETMQQNQITLYLHLTDLIRTEINLKNFGGGGDADAPPQALTDLQNDDPVGFRKALAPYLSILCRAVLVFAKSLSVPNNTEVMRSSLGARCLTILLALPLRGTKFTALYDEILFVLDSLTSSDTDFCCLLDTSADKQALLILDHCQDLGFLSITQLLAFLSNRIQHGSTEVSLSLVRWGLFGTLFQLVSEHLAQIDIAQAAMAVIYSSIPKSTPVKELLYFGHSSDSAKVNPIVKTELDRLVDTPGRNFPALIFSAIKDTLPNLKMNAYIIGFIAFASFFSDHFASKIVTADVSDKIRTIYLSQADPQVRAHFAGNGGPIPQDEILTTPDPLHDINDAFDPLKHISSVAIFCWSAFVASDPTNPHLRIADLATLAEGTVELGDNIGEYAFTWNYFGSLLILLIRHAAKDVLPHLGRTLDVCQSEIQFSQHHLPYFLALELTKVSEREWKSPQDPINGSTNEFGPLLIRVISYEDPTTFMNYSDGVAQNRLKNLALFFRMLSYTWTMSANRPSSLAMSPRSLLEFVSVNLVSTIDDESTLRHGRAIAHWKRTFQAVLPKAEAAVEPSLPAPSGAAFSTATTSTSSASTAAPTTSSSPAPTLTSTKKTTSASTPASEEKEEKKEWQESKTKGPQSLAEIVELKLRAAQLPPPAATPTEEPKEPPSKPVAPPPDPGEVAEEDRLARVAQVRAAKRADLSTPEKRLRSMLDVLLEMDKPEFLNNPKAPPRPLPPPRVVVEKKKAKKHKKKRKSSMDESQASGEGSDSFKPVSSSSGSSSSDEDEGFETDPAEDSAVESEALKPSDGPEDDADYESGSDVAFGDGPPRRKWKKLNFLPKLFRRRGRSPTPPSSSSSPPTTDSDESASESYVESSPSYDNPGGSPEYFSLNDEFEPWMKLLSTSSALNTSISSDKPAYPHYGLGLSDDEADTDMAVASFRSASATATATTTSTGKDPASSVSDLLQMFEEFDLESSDHTAAIRPPKLRRVKFSLPELTAPPLPAQALPNHYNPLPPFAARRDDEDGWDEDDDDYEDSEEDDDDGSDEHSLPSLGGQRRADEYLGDDFNVLLTDSATGVDSALLDTTTSGTTTVGSTSGTPGPNSLPYGGLLLPDFVAEEALWALCKLWRPPVVSRMSMHAVDISKSLDTLLMKVIWKAKLRRISVLAACFGLNILRFNSVQPNREKYLKLFAPFIRRELLYPRANVIRASTKSSVPSQASAAAVPAEDAPKPSVETFSVYGIVFSQVWTCPSPPVLADVKMMEYVLFAFRCHPYICGDHPVSDIIRRVYEMFESLAPSSADFTIEVLRLLRAPHFLTEAWHYSNRHVFLASLSKLLEDTFLNNDVVWRYSARLLLDWLLFAQSRPAPPSSPSTSALRSSPDQTTDPLSLQCATGLRDRLLDWLERQMSPKMGSPVSALLQRLPLPPAEKMQSYITTAIAKWPQLGSSDIRSYTADLMAYFCASSAEARDALAKTGLITLVIRHESDEFLGDKLYALFALILTPETISPFLSSINTNNQVSWMLNYSYKACAILTCSALQKDEPTSCSEFVHNALNLLTVDLAYYYNVDLGAGSDVMADFFLLLSEELREKVPDDVLKLIEVARIHPGRRERLQQLRPSVFPSATTSASPKPTKNRWLQTSDKVFVTAQGKLPGHRGFNTEWSCVKITPGFGFFLLPKLKNYLLLDNSVVSFSFEISQLASITEAERYTSFFGLADKAVFNALTSKDNPCNELGFSRFTDLPNTVAFDPIGGVLFVNGRKRRVRSSSAIYLRSGQKKYFMAFDVNSGKIAFGSDESNFTQTKWATEHLGLAKLSVAAAVTRRIPIVIKHENNPPQWLLNAIKW